MVTAFKIAKNLNEVSLEELISPLRRNEIELDANEPQKKGKSIALKSNIKKCTNAFQAREEDPDDSDSEDDQANCALMATEDVGLDSTSESDSEEVFSEL